MDLLPLPQYDSIGDHQILRLVQVAHPAIQGIRQSGEKLGGRELLAALPHGDQRAADADLPRQITLAEAQPLPILPDLSLQNLTTSFLAICSASCYANCK
uniref:Uncharacterized protein n=1 Tax=Siphoviridae sp. ct4fm14 TaxID=2825331 RepID=A0A8S5UT99_9CAUD|nr:MAG TPA: hypothetical protein [Siphoviridae sp. ct4fm14]